MKTLKSNPKMKNDAAILPFIIALFFMASCAKEDAIQPSASAAIQSDEAAKIAKLHSVEAFAVANPIDRAFTMIQIEHKSRFASSVLNSTLADYSVIVKSNGTVTYEGRANVKKVGKVEFSIGASELRTLSMLFAEADFNNIVDNLVCIPNRPLTLTTFQEKAGERGKTLVDFGQGYPATLIQLRTEVEDILHISQYVKGNILAGVIGKSDL
jgi:hypothetical protein